MVNKTKFGFWEIMLLALALAYFGGILYTHTYLCGADIPDFLNLNANTAQLTTLKSANLPVFGLFAFLYESLGLSNEIIKALIAFVCLIVILFAIYKISLCIFDNKTAAIFACVLFLFSSLFFASFFSNSSFIDDSNTDSLSYAALMLAILFWFENKLIISALFSGLSFGCHPILPLGFIAVLGVYSLINYKSIGIKKIVFSGIVFAAVTFPVLAGIAKSILLTFGGSSAGGLNSDLIWKYVRIVQPQTIFLNIDHRFKYAVALYLSAFLLFPILKNQSDGARRQVLKKACLLLFIISAIVIFELFNSHYFRFIPIFNLWLHRFMSYSSVIVYIVLCAAAVCIKSTSKIDDIYKTGLFMLLGSSVVWAYLKHPIFIWLGHLAILGLTIAYLAYKLLACKRRGAVSYRYSLKIGSIFLIAVILVGLYGKYSRPDYLKSNFYMYERPLLKWVRENTAENDEFLVPFSMFMWQQSKRPALYDSNIVNGTSYNKAFIMDAIKRFEILSGLDLKKMTMADIDKISPVDKGWGKIKKFLNERYDNLTEGDVFKLKKDFDIKYFVASAEKKYNFSLVYKNDKYAVYKLD